MQSHSTAFGYGDYNLLGTVLEGAGESEARNSRRVCSQRVGGQGRAAGPVVVLVVKRRDGWRAGGGPFGHTGHAARPKAEATVSAGDRRQATGSSCRCRSRWPNGSGRAGVRACVRAGVRAACSVV